MGEPREGEPLSLRSNTSFPGADKGPEPPIGPEGEPRIADASARHDGPPGDAAEPVADDVAWAPDETHAGAWWPDDSPFGSLDGTTASESSLAAPYESAYEPTEDEILLQPVAAAAAASDPRLASGSLLASIGGLVISVLFHVWLLSTLGLLELGTPSEFDPPTELLTRFLESKPLEDPEKLAPFELANPNDQEFEVKKVVNAASLGLEKVLVVKPQSAPVDTLREMSPESRIPSTYDIPEGLQVSDMIVTKGTIGDGAVQIESALDRVTWEIAAHLRERKVMVTWLIDGSGSLLEQKAAIVKRMHRIYGELDALEQTEQIPRQEKGLLTGVVTYGDRTQFMTNEPTDKFDEILKAFDRIPIDTTGRENVFSAVQHVLKRWGTYRTSQGRALLVIIVTDETGDDFDQTENAILMARRYGAKTYVVGPPAAFGRRKGYVAYVHPDDKKTYDLPVDLGPETFALEAVSMPFWFNGPQYEYLSAGVGPYSLSRLVHETGGSYFMTNMTTSRGLAPLGAFGSEPMKAFLPDYRFGVPEDYIRDVKAHPIRNAVMTASERSLKYKANSTPRLELKVTANNYLQTLNDAQRSVAETSYMVENILQPFQGNFEPHYQKEPSARWRANYNLALGRLLALKVRSYEYNFACAQLKQLGGTDISSKSNHWYFKPDAQLTSGPQMKKVANEAERLLKRCIEEAPGTPWALLAQRELAHPLGIQVIQKFDPPPLPRPANPVNNNVPKKKAVQLANDEVRKKAAPPKPGPPPALPKL